MTFQRHPALDKPVQMMVSEIAFEHKPHTPVEYARLDASYANRTLDSPLDMMAVISGGYSFTAVHRDNKRCKENWQQAQYIAVDLEKSPDAALDRLDQNQFFMAHGFLSYTTYSHSEEAPRSRALFMLDKPIVDVALWHAAARAVVGFFGVAVDMGSVNVSRAFLGNPRTECRIYANILPYDVCYVLAQQQLRLDAEQKSRVSRQRDDVRPDSGTSRHASPDTMQRWLHDLRFAGEGTRNNTLNRVAFLIGRYIVARGVLSEREALAQIVEAASASGLDAQEVHRTAQAALRKGAN